MEEEIQMTTTQTHEIMTVKEVCEMLGKKTRQTIYNYIKRGILHQIKPQGYKYAIGVTRASVMKLLDSNEETPK